MHKPVYIATYKYLSEKCEITIRTSAFGTLKDVI